MKFLRTILIASFTTALLAGCASSTASETEEKTAATVAQTILEACDDDMEQQDESTVIRLLGLDESTVKEAVGYTGKEHKEDLLLVVVSDNAEDASAVNDSMNYYLDTLKNTASMYNPQQLSKIQNAYITTSSDISVMAVADDMTAVKKAAASALR